MTEEWFSELKRAYSRLPNYEAAYALLEQLYFRLLDECTCDSGILLVGCFAKTDFLLKEKGASSDLRRMVNAMRLRLTRNGRERLSEDFLYDFRSLCLFVSFLYSSPVPDFLSDKFPCEQRRERRQELLADAIRLIVERWDEEFVYCSGEQEEGLLTVRYAGEGQLLGFDHSYVGRILHKGMILNIIRPRKDNQGVLLPEFFIVEPDHLVDVSTIASCFESYAESPSVAFFNRMIPATITESILIGNLASELLDSILHRRESNEFTVEEQQRLYRKSVAKFFRKNALGVMCAKPGRGFHEQAWKQMLNISSAVDAVLPKQLKRYERSGIILEPTFISEMLGLQGRMDMLQADMRVLVEQKSGKAAFVPGHDANDTPHYKEQHYIQMLLYMAIVKYNYRKQYEENKQELHSFLLYSKYEHPLVGLGFAPELLFRALMLRNLYVVQENELRNGGLVDLMMQNPEHFNEKRVEGVLWQVYQRPRIEGFLSRFQCASPLERAYFLRFYSFVALEHKLSKVGAQTKECSGFASAWLSTLNEKLQCGNILLGMKVKTACTDESGQVEHLHFVYDGESGNFRQGDIVIVYPYADGLEPDMRSTIVYRATISRIEASVITLHLRNSQHDEAIFRNREDILWCLEHDFMESSYSSLYKGLYSFLCAPEERRGLLLLQHRPRVVRDKALCGDYGNFNLLQQKIKDAKELFLLIGPPGTGKTSFGMLNTLQEELMGADSRILIVSYTNRAVDEICSKLYPSIDFVRLGGVACASDLYKNRYFDNIVAECASSAELTERMSKARVVVGTTSSVTAHLPLIAMHRFSLCIVDEAGQILEPHLLPLFSLCCKDGLPCISKFVMIGDHKQLPAVVQQKTTESRVDEPLLKEISLDDCRKSLFERFLARYGTDAELCHMLTSQGRMHRDIAHFPNIAFYGGQLQEVPLEHQLSESSAPRVRFVHVPSPEDSLSDKVNLAEAALIADELVAIWEQNREVFNPLETVGVIVPYRNQISAIRSVLAEKLSQSEHPLLAITIDTVERFQGSQRRYIIYGLTVQRHYQLRFIAESAFEENGVLIDRKLNVAMTRAQDYLLIVGNAGLLSRIPIYDRLLRYIQERYS